MAKLYSSAEGEHMAVVAIDIGTTYTGYAYSYRHDYQNIYTSTTGRTFTKDRFPTTVLLNPDKSFNSLGFDAEDTYARLADNEDYKNWFYFRRFKTRLYMTDKVSRDITIKDSEGRPISGLFIFAIIIQRLKDCARASLSESITNMQDNAILWIITVPIISVWSDSATKFVREAALRAGITRNQLKIVPEPEAASLFFQQEPTTKTVSRSKEPVKLSEGHKYILADLGGGTVDVYAYQILADGNLRELYQATGSAIGGACVGVAFQHFMMQLVGAELWIAFKERFKDEFLNIMRDFEISKTKFSTSTKEEQVFRLPSELTNVIQERLSQTLKETIPQTNMFEGISVNKRNELKISVKVMKSFFKTTVQGIIKLLKEVLAETDCDNIKTLLLTGGLSESPYIREVIKTALPGVHVILPPQGSLAVMKGAVLMGYKPIRSTEMRARFSYGISYIELFRKGVHPENLKYTRDGVDYCSRKFDKIIEKGQVLAYGQVINYSAYGNCKAKESKNKSKYTTLYKSTQADPTYCTAEEGCSRVWRIGKKPPTKGWPDRVELQYQITVGEDVSSVKLYNKTTRDRYTPKIDFL